LESVIVKTVAGFMNAKGGTLLVGIGPKGEILGIENDYATLQKDPTRDGFEQKLTHLLANSLGKEFIPLRTCAGCVSILAPSLFTLRRRTTLSSTLGWGTQPNR
jgi:hypothetical protein